MSYLGDISLGDTIDFKFTTVTTTGAPTTLASSPVISAYPDNSTTQLTAGITLSVDFDSVTGLNNVRVVASNGNGYAAGSNYALVITTGTVGGTSVVGYVIGEFSIQARSALMPATIGRKLVVDAAGLADANMVKAGPSGSGTAQTAADIGTKAASMTFTVANQLDSNVLDWKSATAPAMTGDAFARLGAPAGASVSADVAAVKADTAAVKTQTDKFAFTVANQVDANVLDWKSATAPAMTGDAFARLGAPAGASVSADVAAVKANTTTLVAGCTLTSGERNSTADAVLDRDMSTGTDSGSTTVRTVRQSLRFLRNKWAIASGTLTVYKEDDSTASWTSAVTTDAAANPVISNDPAGP